jgi:hypothetical protein
MHIAQAERRYTRPGLRTYFLRFSVFLSASPARNASPRNASH